MDSMKKMGYGMPVILVTGKTEANTRDLAIEAGAVGFLQKPFLEDSLMSLIKELQGQTS
jgi:FixJ family two-component response regulator